MDDVCHFELTFLYDKNSKLYKIPLIHSNLVKVRRVLKLKRKTDKQEPKWDKLANSHALKCCNMRLMSFHACNPHASLDVPKRK